LCKDFDCWGAVAFSAEVLEHVTQKQMPAVSNLAASSQPAMYRQATQQVGMSVEYSLCDVAKQNLGRGLDPDLSQDKIRMSKTAALNLLL
jgi:hypothetical protein